MKALLENKFALFCAAGAAGGLVAFLAFTGWYAQAPQTEDATWSLGPLRANSTYVVGIGALSMSVALVLAFAQSAYLGAARPARKVLEAALISAVAGVGGGFLAAHVGHIAFASEHAARFAGWTIGCAGVGLAVAVCVVNMPKAAGVAGGAAAGLLGCAAHYASGGRGVDALLVGFVTAGAIAGLALAAVERSQRTVWLEVAVFPEGRRDEVRTVELSLGADAVRLGYARSADVRLEAMSNAPQMYAEVLLINGVAEFRDLVSGKVFPLTESMRIGVSNAELRLRRKPATRG